MTTASNGTQAQVKSFHQSAFNWLETQSYVERATIFGFWAFNNPPDGYATPYNALFNGDASLRDLAVSTIVSLRKGACILADFCSLVLVHLGLSTLASLLLPLSAPNHRSSLHFFAGPGGWKARRWLAFRRVNFPFEPARHMLYLL